MNIIVKAIGGSKLYGIDTPTSDLDIRGVFIPTLPELLIEKVETVEEKPDTVYHSLEKFVRLCLNGNPSCLELLFTPESHILERTKDWSYLTFIRKEFLSKRVLKSYGGFLKHQIADFKKNKTDSKALVHAYRLANQLAYICAYHTLDPILHSEYVQDIRNIYVGAYDLTSILNVIENCLVEASKTTLPDEPNTKRIQDCMIKLHEWSYRSC